MGLQVIGAGFGRTGTLSLKGALEQLGFDRCYHMMEVVQNPHHRDYWLAAARGQRLDWNEVFVGYQASVDWPSARFWREQLQAFPDAKVILSRRNGEDWYRSVMNTIWKASAMAAASGSEHSQFAFEVIWDWHFDRRMDDKDHVIAVYEAHNQAVIDEVPADQLLIYTPGDGWGPLCEFFDCEVPQRDYPRTNSTEEFAQLWRKRDDGRPMESE